MPDDSPVPVTSVSTSTSPATCCCTGVTGHRMTHTLGQPGCNNG